MKTFLSIIAMLFLWSTAYACSWTPKSFCESLTNYDAHHPSNIVVSGIVVGADEDGADLEIIEVLKGIETRSVIRIWDGTDFDCNGPFSMAAADFLTEGDQVIIILPEIMEIENSWEQLGDYRLPDVWLLNPLLKVENGEITGFIHGSAYSGSDLWLTSLGYNYFVNKFLQSGACDFESQNLRIQFFHDENENGEYRFDENHLPIGAVTVNGTDKYLNTKLSGIDIFADEGSNNISFDDALVPNWRITTAASIDLDLSFDKNEVIQIGLIPTTDFSNITTNVVNDRFRCGEEVAFTFVVQNEGTVTDSGVAWLEVDENLEAHSFRKRPDYITEGRVGWDFEDLEPYEQIAIGFTITAPLVENEDQLENIYVIKAFTEVNNNSVRSNSCHEIELRCAFDPNDKRSFPIREDKLALIDQPLRYTIRFQNKGNDYAKDVVVADTLDENLDRATFRLIDTSHPSHLNIATDDGYAISFEFHNIFLADSMTNEPASHGHITYEIAPKAGIALETEINNTAHIYFDFNPAIVTNTTESIMVDAFPVSQVSESEKDLISIYPNPASDILYFDQEADRVRLFNLSGELVLHQTRVSELSLEGIVEGLHIIDLELDGKQLRKKVMVTK